MRQQMYNMKLSLLHESMADLIANTVKVIVDFLEDKGYSDISTGFPIGGMGIIRMHNRCEAIEDARDRNINAFVVTITVSDAKWPIVVIDAGLSGMGIVSKEETDFSKPDSLDKIFSFVQRFVGRNEEEIRRAYNIACAMWTDYYAKQGIKYR